MSGERKKSELKGASKGMYESMSESKLKEMAATIIRVREQLRMMELETEAQIAARGLTKGVDADRYGSDFDPLEMDRFTRFQELTRMMAESVNDVATVQRSLQRTLQSPEDDLAAPARDDP